jgi:hypothetical protein
MTPNHREWLARVRRAVRQALLDLEFGRFETAFLPLRECYHDEVTVTDVTVEVKNLIASLAYADPGEVRRRPAMRAAAVRRLHDTKKFISDALIAPTTGSNPNR